LRDISNGKKITSFFPVILKESYGQAGVQAKPVLASAAWLPFNQKFLPE
jgi:hypothetical protein